MVPLEYCQQCRGAAQEISISGIGDMRRDIFSTPKQRFVLKPCGTCMELRTAFLNKLEKDHRHRLHLARVSSALGCYRCPEHPSDYQFIRLTEGTPIKTWWEMSKTSLKTFHRQSFQSVSALEICTSNVEYCDSCSIKADDGFDDNIQITLCERCLEVRDAYIDRVYHEVVFMAAGLLQWPQDVVFVEEILHIEEFGPDSYRERFLEKTFVSFGLPANNVAPAIAFGLVGAAGTAAGIASAVYARRALRMQNMQNRGGDIERGQALRMDLRAPSGVNSDPQEVQPPGQSKSIFNACLMTISLRSGQSHDGPITVQPRNPQSIDRETRPHIDATVSSISTDDDSCSIQTFITAQESIRMSEASLPVCSNTKDQAESDLQTQDQ
jgi:hypothetical protein